MIDVEVGQKVEVGEFPVYGDWSHAPGDVGKVVYVEEDEVGVGFDMENGEKDLVVSYAEDWETEFSVVEDGDTS